MNNIVNNGGPLPPAPHDWLKRFRDYESQLTELREKLRVAEEDRAKWIKSTANLCRCLEAANEEKHCIPLLEDALLAHRQWAEHFEKNPEVEKQYLATGEWDDAKTHRQYEEMYRRVIDLLKKLQAGELQNIPTSNLIAERALAWARERETCGHCSVHYICPKHANELSEFATLSEKTDKEGKI